MRAFICRVLNLVLRIYFRRIEMAGSEHLPHKGGLLFALNHPNALVDPLFLLCRSERPVSFMAKAPLFSMPVIGAFARALDCLPVYRHQDQADTSRNRETFERARQILQRQGAIAIFPEGTTHSDPHLRPLKTGAARIALGAVSASAGQLQLHVVPAGLFYTRKWTFRSDALVYFGEPIAVDTVACGADGEPPVDAVTALSEKIRLALEQVTLNAEHQEALDLIALGEQIWSGDEESLARQFETRRLFLEGYSYFRQRAPRRLEALIERMRRYQADLAQAGLEARALPSAGYSAQGVVRYTTRNLMRFAVTLPGAVLGALVHWPAYRFVGCVARRYMRRDETAVATVKLCGAMLLFPLSWLGAGLLAHHLGVGPLVSFLITLASPFWGYWSLRFMERWDRFLAAARALGVFLTRRDFFERLQRERQAIHHDITALGEEWRAS